MRAVEAQSIPNAFGAQLFQRLRDHDPETTPALAWLHRTFAAQGTTADDIVHSEHQRQGAVNLSVRNVITSLRLIIIGRLGKIFREREPRRRIDARAQFVRFIRLFDARPVPARDRRSVAPLAAHGERGGHALEKALDSGLQRCLGPHGRAAQPELRHALEPGYYLVSDGPPNWNGNWLSRPVESAFGALDPRHGRRRLRGRHRLS
jgi:cyclic beta-1,2-glucan synthetase